MPMLAAVLAIAFQGAQSDAVPAGVLPYGSSPELSQAVQKIAKLTQAGDPAGAKALLRLLPGRHIKVQWDDAAVPESARIDYANSRDTVFHEWKNAVGLSDFEVVKSSP